MIVFGGSSRLDVNGEKILTWLNDLWLFDVDNLFWEQINPVGEIIPKQRGFKNKKKILF